MRPVSDRFLASLRGSHGRAVQALVVSAGQTGVTPDGVEIEVIDGDVHLDAGASIRATLELTTPGDGSFPQRASDALAPYGNEVFLRRGIRFSGGSVEYVSLGYFRIKSAEQEDAPNGPVRVVAEDRMAGIVDARMLAPVQFSATDTFGDIVSQLVLEVYPWATIEWDDFTETDPIARSVIAEEDRWQFLDDLVSSVGKIWYWDHRGFLVIKTAPDPDEAVWDVNSGENGVLVSIGREISREGVYNAVVATGEALDTLPPPRGVATDDNPSSPTFWGGSFGKVPRFYSSPFITTDTQAQGTAVAFLRKTLGLPYNVDFQAVVNPALEPFDPIRVKYVSRIEIHVIDQLTIPLDVNTPMSAVTREQTLVVVGA